MGVNKMEFGILSRIIVLLKKIFCIYHKKKLQLQSEILSKDQKSKSSAVAESKVIKVEKSEAHVKSEKIDEGEKIKRKVNEIVKTETDRIFDEETHEEEQIVTEKEDAGKIGGKEVDKRFTETSRKDKDIEKTETRESSRRLEGIEKERERKKKKGKPYKKKSPTDSAKVLKETGEKQKTYPPRQNKVDLGKRKQVKQIKPTDISAGITTSEEKRKEKLTEHSTRVMAPFVELDIDNVKTFLVVPKQCLKLRNFSKKQLAYKIHLNDEVKELLVETANSGEYLETAEKRIELEKPIKNFEVIFPSEFGNRTYRYKHQNDFIYVFSAVGNNLGRMHHLYDINGNINLLPKKEVWILLKEDFELNFEPDIIEERWVWENYQPLRINLKEINELIVRSRQTGQEEKIPCENTFSIEGEELVEDDFKELAPIFTGKTIKIKAPRVNLSGWVVWIQNKQAGYRVIAENWTGAKKLELKLPSDLPCECGEFQIDICEQSKSIPVETLFFRYVPFLQLEYPKEPIVPNPHHRHRTESIKLVLGSNFQEWELKTHEKVEFIENGYQIELPPEQDILHFSITKRNKPETEVRFQITIPRVKWKISKQETWNDEPLQIKRDELIPGSELYLIVCTNSMGDKYDLLAILKSNDQILQEGKFSKKGMNYFLFLNKFRETLLNNSGKLTLTVGINNKLWFDAIYFPPDINRLKKILNLLKSIGYQDIPDFDTTLEQEYEKAEIIIHEKLNNLREVCEYIVRESKNVIYRDLLKDAQEDFNQNNLIGVINKYSRIIYNFRDDMNEVLKSLYDELEEVQKANKFIEDFFNKYLKENMVKMGEICSMQPLQKRDIKIFYENRNKVIENINIIKYKMNEFWILFVSDMKRLGNIQYLVRKWQYFKNRDGNLDNIDEDFDEKYIFEPLRESLRENDEIRRTILKFFIPKSLNELNLNYRLGFIGFLSQKDKELAMRDANRFFDKLLKLKKEIQNELEVNKNGDGPS